jgi:hypothetical protein
MEAADDGDARQAGAPKLSFLVRLKHLLARPDLAFCAATARSVGDGRSGATRSIANGEHRTFPVVSTVAG